MPNDRKNKIRLGDSTEINENLKPVKIGGVNSPIELSKDELRVVGTINADAINVGGAAVQTGTDAGATELNELSDVTYSSGDLTITSLDTIIASGLTLDVGGIIKLDSHTGYFNFLLAGGTDDYMQIRVAASGETTIKTIDAVGSVGHLNLDVDGDIILEPAGGDTRFQLNATNYCNLNIDATGATEISTVDSDGTVGHLTLAPDGSLILDPADGKYIAKANGTEFSAADSAYAGMILGFTIDGNDSADQTYNLTTSYVVFDSDLSVTFKTPPSEKVEIQATFYYQQGNSGNNVLATISNASSYASNSLHHSLQHERAVTAGSERGGQGIVTVSWYMIAIALEPIGSSQTIYFGAKCNSTTGTPNITWGGDASGDYQNFVMRAIALPA